MSDKGPDKQTGRGEGEGTGIGWYEVVLLALGSEPKLTTDGVIGDTAILSSQFGLDSDEWEQRAQEAFTRAQADGHVEQVGEGEWALTLAGREVLTGIIGAEELDS